MDRVERLENQVEDMRKELAVLNGQVVSKLDYVIGKLRETEKINHELRAMIKAAKNG